MDWIKNYEAKNKKEAEDKDHLLRLDGRLISVDRSAPYHYTCLLYTSDAADE